MGKIKAFCKKCVSYVKTNATKIVVSMMAAVPMVPMTAEGTSNVDVSSTVESIKGLLGDFSVANLTIIIGAGLALTVGLIIFWFAFRYLYRKVLKALKKGGA